MLMGTPTVAERANLFRDRAQHLLKLAELEHAPASRAALFLSMAYGYHQMAQQVQSGTKFKL
jgi:hypothetical protein